MLKRNLVSSNIFQILIGIFVILYNVQSLKTNDILRNEAEVLHWDDAHRVPTFLHLKTRNIRRSPQNLSIEEIGRDTINDLDSFFNLKVSENSEVVLSNIHDNGKGPILAQYKHVINGLDVYNQRATVIISRSNLMPLAIAGYLTNPDSAKTNSFRSRDIRQLGFIHDIESIINVVAQELSPNGFVEIESIREASPSSCSSTPSSIYRIATLKQNDIISQPIRYKPILYQDQNTLMSSYYLEIYTSTNFLFSYIVSSENGEILAKHEETHHSFNYRVPGPNNNYVYESYYGHTNPNPTGTNNGHIYSSVSPTLLSLDNYPFSKNDPWLSNSGTSTNGNNVYAYADIVQPDGYNSGDILPTTTSPGTFDRFYDPSSLPNSNNNQIATIVTYAFFTLNYLHDFFYDAGFDEKSGNTQFNNYGRGGWGGDELILETQDWDTTINIARVTTPADGISPKIQLRLFNSIVDPALDNSILSHEWGHVLCSRLMTLQNGQGMALSEGFSDFIALLMSAWPGDVNVNGNDLYQGSYSVGYLLARSVDNSTAAYYGVRRLPYSTNMTKNPLTFKHIADGEVLPSVVTYSYTFASTDNSNAYNAGEVWCVTLWEIYTRLLNTYSFTEARDLMKLYLISSMKVMPINPTFLEARDAFISVMNDTDVMLGWSGFAVRGMGRDAVAPDRTSTNMSGIIESYRAEDITTNVITTIEISTSDVTTGEFTSSDLSTGVTSGVTSSSVTSSSVTSSQITSTELTTQNNKTITTQIISAPVDDGKVSKTTAVVVGITVPLVGVIVITLIGIIIQYKKKKRGGSSDIDNDIELK